MRVFAPLCGPDRLERQLQTHLNDTRLNQHARGPSETSSITQIPGSLDPNNPASRWINPAAFSIAPAFTFGNVPNLLDGVRNPGILVENFSAIKKTVQVLPDE